VIPALPKLTPGGLKRGRREKNMNRKKLTFSMFCFFLILFILAESHLTNAYEKNQISGLYYQDKNGYFACIPPQGWKQEDFPEETIRSKVIFLDPQNIPIHIIVLSGPERNNYDLNLLFEDTSQRINQLRKKYSNGTFQVILSERVEWGNRKAIIIKSIIPSIIYQETIQALNKNIYYSISFTATTQNEYNKHYEVFQKFLKNFLILELDKKFSEADLLKCSISRYKALAKTYEMLGNIGAAIDCIQNAISLDPNNKELLDLKSKYESQLSR